MARNIEIKARIDDLAALAARAAASADEGPIEIVQDDTFFKCDSGRLKLRSFPDGTGELIYYRRADGQGPKESFYVRSPTSAPDKLRESLILAYGSVGRVKKHRTLFMIGRTRVHLDRVEGLGQFLELMETLGVQPSHLVERAYVDLLEGNRGDPIRLQSSGKPARDRGTGGLE